MCHQNVKIWPKLKMIFLMILSDLRASRAPFQSISARLGPCSAFCFLLAVQNIAIIDFRCWRVYEIGKVASMINFCSLEAGNEVASILQLLLVSFSSARFLGLALFYLFFLNWSLCFCLFVFCSCSCPLWCVLLLLLLLLLFFFACSALFLSSQWGCYFLLCLLFQFFVVGVFRWLAWLSILICLLPCSLTCVLACLVACLPACLLAFNVCVTLHVCLIFR